MTGQDFYTTQGSGWLEMLFFYTHQESLLTDTTLRFLHPKADISVLKCQNASAMLMSETLRDAPLLYCRSPNTIERKRETPS